MIAPEDGVAALFGELAWGDRATCQAVYMAGATDDSKSYVCGGNLQTRHAICDGLRTVYKHENEDKLQTDGGFDPGMCVTTPPAGP